MDRSHHDREVSLRLHLRLKAALVDSGRALGSFKLILDFLLNRVNTINGCRYGDDPTILAWETGNEMNYRGMRPAPASWTLMVAKHLKSRAPRTLVMDGSFARNDDVDACYPKEVLESSDVDIISYHYCRSCFP